jgi:hypothetical protein
LDQDGIDQIPFFKRDQNGDVIKNQIQEGINEESAIQTKTKIYLLEKLRNFTMSVLPNGKLVLPFKNYFPYTMTAVRPLKLNGFNVEVKLHHQNQFIFPKILSNSQIFKGIINKKSSGLDMLNIILVQGGRNVLYSNLYQSSSFNSNLKNEKKYSYIKPNTQVFTGSTFKFQIKRKSNDNNDSFSSKSHLADFYLKELGLDLGIMNTSTYDDFNHYWTHVRTQQKKLQEMLMGKNVINIGSFDYYGDCNFFKDQFMFREKKNLMELLALTGKSVFFC